MVADVCNLEEARLIKELAKGMAVRLALRAAVAMIGLAAVLAYWTLTDKGHKGATSTSSDKMPAKILGGGGQKLAIDVDTTGPAQLAVDTYIPRKPDQSINDDQPTEEHVEKFGPGHHTWVIELAPRTGGTFEFEAINPQVGTQLSWTVTLGGKQIAQESDTLDKPLQPGYAFFLQAKIDPDEQEQQSESSGAHE
ncbi:MAG TPA: hypothetical protein VFA71_02725 [Terriglobales bacterium]|nr:hypothetical protein [Terriglobales bacterium]